MKKIILLTGFLVVAAGAALAVAGGDDRDDRDRDGCHNIRATIIDAPSSDGCTSPFNFCAAGNVTGNHGLDGTTFYTFDGFAAAPATAPGLGESTGILVYTTPHGTLTVRETGVGNMGSQALGGVGASLEQVQSGTGRFTGATGTLYLASTAANGQYTALVTGQLCYP
jgi:hypothetical protein